LNFIQIIQNILQIDASDGQVDHKRTDQNAEDNFFVH